MKVLLYTSWKYSGLVLTLNFRLSRSTKTRAHTHTRTHRALAACDSNVKSRNLNKVWVCLMWNKSDIDSPWNKSAIDSPEPGGSSCRPSLLFSFCSPVLSAGPGQLPRLQEGGGSTEEDFVPALKVPSGGPACPSCLRTIGWTESTWGMLRMCCSHIVSPKETLFLRKRECGYWQSAHHLCCALELAVCGKMPVLSLPT